MADLTAIDGAIAALEAQRDLLGDAVVDTALAPLLAQRSELHERAMVEQRRLVTILFSDVVDFTVLSQQLDAEDVRTVMDAYFLRWHEHIAANGGVVEKFIGDAVMAVFGLRAADEEDPCRAIRAALAMRASLDEVNAEVGAAHGITLAMRVGIDTGDVVVSTLGERPGQDFVVVGEVVNRASRIQGAAPPGGVLVSADTFRHVRGAFDVQPVTGLRLKGIDQPVDAYLIQGERVQGFRADAARGVEGVVTRTIGRELELRQLQEHFQEVGEERRWQVVTVVGDAGVGKTRLLSEFARWLDELPQPVWWFGGRAAPSRASLPYALLHDLFAARLGINDSDGPSEVRRKWERGVAQALGSSPDAVDKAHVIGYWLGFQIGESASLAGVSDDPAEPQRARRERTSPSTSGASPNRHPSCSCWRTSTGPTRQRSPSCTRPGRCWATARCSWWPARGRPCSSTTRTGARASTSTPGCRCARCRGARRAGSSTRSSSAPTECPLR